MRLSDTSRKGFQLLTIGIPNYNQVAGLRLQENEMRAISQIPGVEILVSDNNSSDGSLNYLADNWSSFARILRSEINIGFQSNARKLVNSSASDWVWILGAGDQIGPTMVRGISETLVTTREEVKLVLGGRAKYKLIAPFISESIWRRVELSEAMETAPIGDTWPQIHWSLELTRNFGPKAVVQFSDLHVEPYRAEDDWHVTGLMSPVSRGLHEVFAAETRNHTCRDELAHDLSIIRKTLLRWYIQDRLNGKVAGFNPHLAYAIRHSGLPFSNWILRLTAIYLSYCPQIIFEWLRKYRRPLSRIKN